MKKYFNYRPLVSISLFAILGIIFASGFFIDLPLYYVLSGGALVILIVSVIIKALKAKEHKIFKIASAVAAFIIFALLAFLNVFVSQNINNFEGEYYFEGRVSKETYISTGGKWVVSLDHGYLVDTARHKTHKLHGKVMLYLTPMDGRVEDYELGSTIKGVLDFAKPKTKFGNNLFYYNNKGVHLLGYGTEEDTSFYHEKDLSLSQRYKRKAKEALEFYIPHEYSELGYTMLFGDKAGLDEDMSESFRASGIAHLLAVSGLHVGFIVALLVGILNLFKASPKVKFFVIVPITFIYALLCGLSVSVTRAFIMTAVLLYFKMRKRSNDSLSSLALAALIILALRPLEIYDAGFRLSFAAVAGIILLAKPFERFFLRAFKPKLSSALAISLSTFLGTLPVMAMHFERLSVCSVFTNLLAIPIASVAFMAMFVSTFMGVIFPALSFGNYIFYGLMYVVTLISKIFASFTFAGANGVLVILFSVLLISSAIFGSDYNFTNEKIKKPLTMVGSVLSLACFVLMFVL